MSLEFFWRNYFCNTSSFQINYFSFHNIIEFSAKYILSSFFLRIIVFWRVIKVSYNLFKKGHHLIFSARSSIAPLLIWSDLIGRLCSISTNQSGEQQCMLALWWVRLNPNFSDFCWLVTLGLIFLITSCLAHIFTNIYNARVLGVAELVHIFMTEHSYSGNAHGVTIAL